MSNSTGGTAKFPLGSGFGALHSPPKPSLGVPPPARRAEVLCGTRLPPTSEWLQLQCLGLLTGGSDRDTIPRFSYRIQQLVDCACSEGPIFWSVIIKKRPWGCVHGFASGEARHIGMRLYRQPDSEYGRSRRRSDERQCGMRHRVRPCSHPC